MFGQAFLPDQSKSQKTGDYYFHFFANIRATLTVSEWLKEAHRAAIVDVLRACRRVERAVLFGSRAKKTLTLGSDMDIALFGKGQTISHQARLAAAMEELNVPQQVDLLLYDRIEYAALREQIR